MTKKRIPIPPVLAAKVLFTSDRTCCVCRVPGKKIQIHHIDDNPSNNEFNNLSVLCLECHGDTQVKGGFGRQLDAEQVKLYRDDWHSQIAVMRVREYREDGSKISDGNSRLRYLSSLIEQLREIEDYVTLAQVYGDLGDIELRDKYITRSLEKDNSDWLLIYLRALQGRRDLIPEEVAKRRLSEQGLNKDWFRRARTLVDLGRSSEAVYDYVLGVLESLKGGRAFTAAYYLKEIWEAGLVSKLFEEALTEAVNDDDLWWQVRCLQELGWTSELDELVIANEEKIKSSGDLRLAELLLRAKGQVDAADQARINHRVSFVYDGEVISMPNDKAKVKELLSDNSPEPELNM